MPDPSIHFATLVAIAVSFFSASSTAAIDEDATYTVDGLVKEAEILVDEWGVPHIYANDHYDVFFVQGFNAARDRLWQIDLWRKRGLGELAAVLGPDYVEQDAAARLFLYRGDMYSEWLAYGNDAKRIAEAFAAGVNAYVKLTKANPDLLPPEFKLLGYAPALWQADDIVRIRSNGLWRNVTTELWRAQMACNGGLELAHAWKQLEPAWETKVPDGLDPCAIPEDVLRKYTLAKAPVDFNDPLSALALNDHPTLAPNLGSNNWVVAGTRTESGHPILADDPHRSHATPSLRYIAHLSGPGINVIGAGEPALPGISIGHNERIAFGLTIFRIDQEDLYVYELAPASSQTGASTEARLGYIYDDGVEPFVEYEETISVAGGDDHLVKLRFTRHGPVVAETATHAYAVRAAWLEPGMSPYFGSIEYMRAQNWREFVGALNRWGAPSENQVYADVDGNIGYKPAGRFPVRRNWDGLMPVPGDGRYEWQGYFDMDVLPEEYNPERGFTGTANSMNLPADYAIDRYRVGFEWSPPWRYSRLWEVLSTDDEHTMADASALQRDYTSVLARRIVAKLPALGEQGPAGALLSEWDFTLGRDSAAAALYNVWYHRHLTPALGERLAAQHQVSLPLETTAVLDSLTVLNMLDTPAGQETAYAALATAVAETTNLLGDDPERWRWGDLHRIEFEHPLYQRANRRLQRAMRLAVHRRGGSGNTTNATSFLADDFRVRSGASFRMVVDVSDWDAARATNAPGQSGDPRSRFYDNLLADWADEGDFPLLYSRTAVEKHTVFSIKLVPNTE